MKTESNGVKGTRLLLAVSNRLIRAGFRALLERIPWIEVVAEAGNGREALALIATHRLDVLLVGMALRGLNGLEVSARVSKDFPKVKTVILSLYANKECVAEALRAGASGYLIKDAATVELELAIKTALNGAVYLSRGISKRAVDNYLKRAGNHVGPFALLTPRQREVLQLIAEGNNTKAIAFALGISVKTVEAHRKQLMDRLSIHDVAGLVRYAMRFGLVLSEIGSS
ncbi:MAG TPA: response regulator transcription factor [Chthoniobacterales bacterium]|nr:response regulator transcription factor [Chthoniobacterales bacterium]